jgi:hypothetical protein
MSARHENEIAYPPLDVLKPLAEKLWIVDGTPMHTMGLVLPVRMTVVRLSSGEMWLHSPTRYDERLRRSIEALGAIRHLVAPNVGHWSFVEDWRRNCPGAMVWAAPKLRDRLPVRLSRLRIDRELEERAPDAWAGEMDQLLLRGVGGYREVVFLHRPSRTLILTDLVANLEADKLTTRTRLAARALGMLASPGRAPAYLRLSVRLRRTEAAKAAVMMVGWAPERVIFAHGRWFDRDATAALRRSLDWLLD